MTDKLLDQYLELRALLYEEKSDDVTIEAVAKGRTEAEYHIHVTTGSVTCLNSLLEEFPDSILHSTESRLCVWRYSK